MIMENSQVSTVNVMVSAYRLNVGVSRKDIDVVLQRRICNQAAIAVALKEAGGDHHQERRHEERHQHQQQW